LTKILNDLTKKKDSMIYMGIDPGQTGALAVIEGQNIKVWDYQDGEALLYLQSLCQPEIYACLEAVHAFPKQGVTSVFNFGTNFGLWQGRLGALNIPYDLVTPTKWQAQVFDSGKKTGDRKQMALDRARRLFPSMLHRLKRKKDDGRADALLIAEYCRRMFQK